MNEKLKKLKYFTTGSFAIWPFDLKKGLREIHCRVIIIGLNPSARIKFGENFHKKRFDLWYKEGFSKSPYAGSYMTDLVSHHEPDSKVVIEKWKNRKFRQRNIKNLQKQFEILGVQESTPILCIGQNTRKLFSSVFPKLRHVFSINHPNSYRIKNNRGIFLRDLKMVGRKIKQ